MVVQFGRAELLKPVMRAFPLLSVKRSDETCRRVSRPQQRISTLWTMGQRDRMAEPSAPSIVECVVVAPVEFCPATLGDEVGHAGVL